MAEEAQLVAEIDRAGWQHVGMRRLVRQFGYQYSFSRRSITPNDTQEPLPDWGAAIAQRIYTDRLTTSLPNQMLANRYLPGEGISFHTDAPGFEEVVSLSLLSACVMEFRQAETGEKQKIWLEPRSLLILSGAARWQWQHGIMNRKRDRHLGREQMRELRISLTFRTFPG